jgi:hypothetical protein
MQSNLLFSVRRPQQIRAFCEEAVIQSPAGNFNPVIAGAIE